MAVFDAEGNPKYTAKTESSARVSLLRAAQGGRFAVVEQGFSFFDSVVNLLGLNNGDTRRFLKVRIFETLSGKQIAEFESDPNGGTGYALSPSGHLLASERTGQLRVVAVP